jgi:hypothetical protein
MERRMRQGQKVPGAECTRNSGSASTLVDVLAVMLSMREADASSNTCGVRRFNRIDLTKWYSRAVTRYANTVASSMDAAAMYARSRLLTQRQTKTIMVEALRMICFHCS